MLFLTCLFVSGHDIQATEVHYSLGSSVTSYDNVNLVNDPQGKEVGTSVWGSFLIAENTSSLQYNIDSRLESTKYANNLSDDRSLGRVTATSTWVLRPGMFDWNLNDTFTQTAINPYLADTPSNRQNANVLSTGPNYYIRINPVNNLNLEARAEHYTYAENIDNNRMFGASRWVYRLNASVDLSLNYELSKVEYLDGVNNNYDRHDLFFRTEYQRNRNTFEAELGTTRVNNEHIENFHNSRYLISINNQRTRTENIQLSYEHSLSDTGTELLNSGEFVQTDTLETTSNDTFVTDTARLLYNELTTYGSFSIETRDSRYKYNTQSSLDNERKSLLIVNQWNLQRASSLMIDAYFLNTSYPDPSINRTDRDKRYEMTYVYGARRNINIRTRVASIERNSTDEIFSYKDMQYMISLEYSSR